MLPNSEDNTAKVYDEKIVSSDTLVLVSMLKVIFNFCFLATAFALIINISDT